MGPLRKRPSSRISKGIPAVQKPRTNDTLEAPFQIGASGEYIADNSLYTAKCKTESDEREEYGVTGALKGEPSGLDRINGKPSKLANAPSFKEVGVNCLSLEKLYKVKDEKEDCNIGDSFSPSIDVNPNEPFQDQKWMLKEENNIFTPEVEDKKVKSFMCFCGKSYTCTSHLNRHRKSHASEGQLPVIQRKSRVSEVKTAQRGFACLCGRQYTRKSNLKRHQIICAEQAQAATTTSAVTNINVVTNMQEPEEKFKPYFCACGKSYTCSSHLYRHQRSHAESRDENEKRYICECGKTYSCSSHLYRHQRTHIEEKASVERQRQEVVEEDLENLEKRIKPHLCFCGKRYTCTSHLYRHQKVQHADNMPPREPPKVKVEEPEPERSYKCDCGKSYTSNSHLQRHQRRHRNQNLTSESNDLDHDSEADVEEYRQKPYTCECGKSFILSFSLLLHKKIHCRWKQTTD